MPNESGVVVNRTVLVLDTHVQQEGTADAIEISLKARKTKSGMTEAQSHSVAKPVLSLCTQAFLEYCRILFDLYPDEPAPTCSPGAADWAKEEQAQREAEQAQAKGARQAKAGAKEGGGQTRDQQGQTRALVPRVFVLPRHADPEKPAESEEAAAVYMDIWQAIPRDARQVLGWMAERCTRSEEAHLHASLRFAVKNLAMTSKGEESSPEAASGRMVVVVQQQAADEEGGPEQAYRYAGREMADTIAAALQQCVRDADDEELVMALRLLDVTVVRLVADDSPQADSCEAVREVELSLSERELEAGEVAKGAGVKHVRVRMQSHWVPVARLCAVMQDLACLHLWLRTVRVTGIPMKEGDNAASTSYDVVLLHRSDAHVSFGSYAEALPLGSGKCMRRNEVDLKWKTTEKKLQTSTLSATCLHRLTPLQLTSSPSQCLVRYLMSDKPVTLVHEGDTSSARYSHMLLQQAGDVFLHCLHQQLPLEDDVPAPLLAFYNKSSADPNLRVAAFSGLIKRNLLCPPPNRLLPLRPCPTTLRQNILDLDLALLPDEEGVRYAAGEAVDAPVVMCAPDMLRSTMLFPYHEHTSILYQSQATANHGLYNLISPLRAYLENPLANAKDLSLCIEIVLKLFRASQVSDASLFPGRDQNWRKDCYQALWGEVMLLAYRSALLYPTSPKTLLSTLQDLFKSQPGALVKKEGANNGKAAAVGGGAAAKQSIRTSTSALSSATSGRQLTASTGSLLPQKRQADGFKEYDRNGKQMRLGTFNHTDVTHQGTTLEEERKGQRAALVDKGLPRSSAGGAFGPSLFHQYWAHANERPTRTLNVL